MPVAIINRRRPVAPVPRRPATPQPTNRMHAKLRSRIEWHERRIAEGGDAETHCGAIRQLRHVIGDPMPEPETPPAEVMVSEPEPEPPRGEPEQRKTLAVSHRVVEAKPSPGRVVRAEPEKEH